MTYSLIIKPALSCNIVFWNGKQLTADANLVLMSSIPFLYVVKGKDGSWITKTLTTTNPSCDFARATLKNLVEPRLKINYYINNTQVNDHKISQMI